ncbi:MAG: alpha/beta hydrolase [Thermoleophilia bacterium]|nr:alpha/beta hydrolase [Thermoleophilia bacterium]
MTTAPVVEVPTPRGPGRVHLHVAPDARGALVMGHGAGGGVGAPDLVAATGAALAEGVSVALVEQPYRVAGRRAPDRAPVLDEAWTAIVAHLREGPLKGLSLVTGGRSSGARVACRTAAATGAAGVLCLAFPLQPAARAGRPPAPGRLPELDGAGVPVLVVQGTRDPFGMPPAGPDRRVVEVPGDHSLRAGLAGVREAVAAWLPGVLGTT